MVRSHDDKLTRTERLKFKNLKNSIKDDLKRIVVMVHRIRLSGRYYKWIDVEALGNLKVNNNPAALKRMPGYNKQVYVWFCGRKLTVYLNPTKGCMPQCIIEMSNPRPVFLSKLCSKLPELKMSVAEYTVDLYFDNQDVRKYFELIYRYIYFQHQNELTLYSKMELADTKRWKNALVRAGKMKLYERGPDNKKKKDGRGGYWLLQDVDRIRIEFRAKKQDLDKHGLALLRLFSKNPLFTRMLEQKFRFRRFKSSSGLPTEFSVYNAMDSQLHSGAFHNQYCEIKNTGLIKNMTQVVEDVPELKPLLAKILYKVLRREERWKNKYEAIHGVKKEKSVKMEESPWETHGVAELKHMGIPTSAIKKKRKLELDIPAEDDV